MEDTMKAVMEMIINKKFNTKINGYDAFEVDAFFLEIHKQLDSLRKTTFYKEARIKELKEQLELLSSEINRLRIQNKTLKMMKNFYSEDNHDKKW